LSSLDSFNRKEAEEEEGEDSVCLKKNKKKSVILKETKIPDKETKTNKLAFCALIENTLPSHNTTIRKKKRIM